VLDLDDRFFRQESGRMVAALTRIFGVHNLGLAEDVVQDACCRALETWQVRGMPENPGAWLMVAAKNRAIDIVRRESRARRFAPELGRLLETEWTLAAAVDEAFDAHIVRDEQLRMMFSCCHPRLPVEAQLALILNILCGFGARAIASALLTGQSAIEKRIARGKQALARTRTLFDLGDEAFAGRLETVRRALYLLFSEGYHGSAAASAVRADLCDEAMRLVGLLCEHTPAATPTTRALASLMYLHAARLPARVDEAGELRALVDHDRSAWDRRLLQRGLELLDASTSGTQLSAYHLEAAIAAMHAAAPSVDATDWHAIVVLYDHWMGLAPSPVIALNRAIAVGQLRGPEQGLRALRSIASRDRLAGYPFYVAAIGELELRRGCHRTARGHFQEAAALARNDAERRFFERRADACRGQG
jgi:predicted RNA polymerase sigma factor